MLFLPDELIAIAQIKVRRVYALPKPAQTAQRVYGERLGRS